MSSEIVSKSQRPTGTSESQVTKKLRVLFLMESMEVAGAEVLVLEMLRRIDRERFEPVVGCLTERGPLADDVETLGIELFALGKKPGLDFSIVGKLSRLMREQRIDVLHTHVWPADVWGRVAAIFSRVPVRITTLHNVCDWKGWNHFLLDRVLARYTDKLVCVSQAVYDFYSEQGRVDREHLQPILNGIDPKDYLTPGDRTKKREELGVAEDIKVMVAVGRLVPQKTHYIFLRVIKEVRKTFPNAQGWIVGDGPLRAKLEAQAKELELGPDALRLLGQRRDVPDLLKAGDVYVLPTAVREGLSLSILEAMAAARPVVAMDVGGNREALEDGRTGRLVPAGDEAGLARAIEETLADPERARLMGLAARESMLEQFTLDRMVHEYEDLYSSCAKARRG